MNRGFLLYYLFLLYHLKWNVFVVCKRIFDCKNNIFIFDRNVYKENYKIICRER